MNPDVKIPNMDISKYEMYLSKSLTAGTEKLEGRAYMNKVVSNIVHNLQVFGNQLHAFVHLKGIIGSERVIQKIDKKFEQLSKDIGKLEKSHQENLLATVIKETKQIVQSLKDAGVPKEKMQGWDEKINLFDDQIKKISNKAIGDQKGSQIKEGDKKIKKPIRQIHGFPGDSGEAKGFKGLVQKIEKAAAEKTEEPKEKAHVEEAKPKEKETAVEAKHVKKSEIDEKNEIATYALRDNIKNWFIELLTLLRFEIEYLHDEIKPIHVFGELPDIREEDISNLSDSLEKLEKKFKDSGKINYSDLNKLTDLIEDLAESKGEVVTDEIKTQLEQIHTQMQILDQGKKHRKNI